MTKPIKLLFLAPYPAEEPVTRFRMYQYIPFLKSHGIHVTISPFMSSYLYKIKNDPGLLKGILKVIIVFFLCIKRFGIIFRVVDYDLIYISKEIFPFGPPFLEKIISHKKKIIYDFDDSVHIANYIGTWRKLCSDKNRVDEILKCASKVIPGNDYLASFAKGIVEPEKVRVLITPIDTDKYYPRTSIGQKKSLVIGWIGTWSNVKYLLMLKEAFISLAKQHNFTLKIVGPRNIYTVQIPNISIQYKLWSLNDEPNDIASFDIGIMPLDDNEWTRGKCGFKIIQYMAVGIPTVASPVGINKSILENGRAGMLASSIDGWARDLSLLLNNDMLRAEMGRYARSTAIEKYSIKTNGPLLENIIRNVYDE